MPRTSGPSKSLGSTGLEIGSIYGTMGVASLFMPGLMGIVADRWLNAERLYGILHLTGAALLMWASTVRDYETLYFIMLANAMVYMPTIALNNSISYRVLEQQGLNFILKFPPICVWGTIGFVIAMWATDLSGTALTTGQLYISAGAALFLGLYGFTMPACPPARGEGKRTIAEALIGMASPGSTGVDLPNTQGRPGCRAAWRWRHRSGNDRAA